MNEEQLNDLRHRIVDGGEYTEEECHIAVQSLISDRLGEINASMAKKDAKGKGKGSKTDLNLDEFL